MRLYNSAEGDFNVLNFTYRTSLLQRPLNEDIISLGYRVSINIHPPIYLFLPLSFFPQHVTMQAERTSCRTRYSLRVKIKF